MSQFRLHEWFQSLDAKQHDVLKKLQSDIFKWNSKINLISPQTMEVADRVHFADSILGLKYFLERPAKGDEVFDLGSGNGFPGLVGAIIYPDLKFVCVDSDQRKIGFIKQFALLADLNNVRTLCTRIESLGHRSIHLGMARGLATVKDILEMAKSLVVAGGEFYHFKGAGWKKELDEGIVAGWKTSVLGQYTLPDSDEKRAILRSLRL